MLMRVQRYAAFSDASAGAIGGASGKVFTAAMNEATDGALERATRSALTEVLL